jgi:hypothetical protein
MADMAIMLSIPKGPTRWRGNLKGLPYEREWLKSADNLDPSPFKGDPSNDTTFSQTISLDSPFKLWGELNNFNPFLFFIPLYRAILHKGSAPVLDMREQWGGGGLHWGKFLT